MTVDLSPLQSSSRPDPAGQIHSARQAAQEFEALFVAQLLKIMRESVESSGLFEESPGQAIYMEMMDQELARSLVRSGGVGLAPLLQSHLQQTQNAKGSSQSGRLEPADLGLSAGSTKNRPSTVAPLQGGSAELVPKQATETHSVHQEASQDSFRLSSDFGWRKDPLTGEFRYHRGIDLAAPVETRVGSVTSGRVVFSGWQGGFGNTVVVESENGTRTRYAHLSQVGVSQGDRVFSGEEIGLVGSTGRATGPHLHIELERDGRVLNPLSDRRTAALLDREIAKGGNLEADMRLSR